MALLRWIYLRKLVPIEELMANGGSAGARSGSSQTPQVSKLAPAILEPFRASTSSSVVSGSSRISQPVERPEAASVVVPGFSRTSPPAEIGLKDALLAEIRKSKVVFYNTVVAQAQKIEVAAGQITFSFSPAQRALRDVFEQNRSWLESIAQRLAGQTIVVAGVQAEAAAPEKSVDEGSSTAASDRKAALREQALADAGVQAMLEVFPAEIRDVEEM
jgi:hypothetical protein